MTTADEQLLEQVVARVLEQLRTPAEPARNGAASNAAAKALVLNERVITGELIESKLNGAPRLEVSAQAILTPSAHDALRKRGVTWSRQGNSNTATKGGGTWTAILVNPSPAIDSTLDDLRRSGLGIEKTTAGCADGAAKLAMKLIREGAATGVVAFTKRPAAAACRANRETNIRAAVVGGAKEIDELKRVLGPNVFCITPEGKAFFELRNILRAITSSAPQKPEKWTD